MIYTAGNGKIKHLIFGAEGHLGDLAHTVILDKVIFDNGNKMVTVQSSDNDGLQNLDYLIPYHEYNTVTALFSKEFVDSLKSADIGIDKGITDAEINSLQHPVRIS